MVTLLLCTYFLGVYLPLLWDSGFCWKSPIALGYTRGHFSALVGIEPDTLIGEAGADLHDDQLQVIFLPLMTQDNKLLPVHFLNEAEVTSYILKNMQNVSVFSRRTSKKAKFRKLGLEPWPFF